METKNKSYKMLKTAQGARDGINVETFQKGETYELEEHLAENFCHMGVVQEVTGRASKNPVDNRETKVTGPSEAKVISPAETKAGEAGVDLDTQNIEELVATARDHYGLEVDSTMSEADVRKLIESAQGESHEDHTAKKPAKAKKAHK